MSEIDPQRERISISLPDRFLLSTCLSFLYKCLIPCRNSKRDRLVNYMGHADQIVDKTLDIRRIFKTERLLSSLARIVLDNEKLVSLAKKQRHGIVLSD